MSTVSHMSLQSQIQTTLNLFFFWDTFLADFTSQLFFQQLQQFIKTMLLLLSTIWQAWLFTSGLFFFMGC